MFSVVCVTRPTMLCVYEFAPQMLEYLVVASKHPNARVRESVLLCFTTAIQSLVCTILL